MGPDAFNSTSSAPYVSRSFLDALCLLDSRVAAGSTGWSSVVGYQTITNRLPEMIIGLSHSSVALCDPDAI